MPQWAKLSERIGQDGALCRLAEEVPTAALLFTWSLPAADLYGILPAEPREYLARVAPAMRLPDAEVWRAIVMQARAGLITLYTANGKLLAYIRRYHKYQDVRWARIASPEYPLPPDWAVPGPLLKVLQAGDGNRTPEDYGLTVDCGVIVPAEPPDLTVLAPEALDEERPPGRTTAPAHSRTLPDTPGRSGTVLDSLGHSGTLPDTPGRSGPVPDSPGHSGTLPDSPGHSRTADDLNIEFDLPRPSTNATVRRLNVERDAAGDAGSGTLRDTPGRSGTLRDTPGRSGPDTDTDTDTDTELTAIQGASHKRTVQGREAGGDQTTAPNGKTASNGNGDHDDPDGAAFELRIDDTGDSSYLQCNWPALRAEIWKLRIPLYLKVRWLRVLVNAIDGDADRWLTDEDEAIALLRRYPPKASEENLPAKWLERVEREERRRLTADDERSRRGEEQERVRRGAALAMARQMLAEWPREQALGIVADAFGHGLAEWAINQIEREQEGDQYDGEGR